MLEIKGIDVSTHNGKIDWPKVKAAGCAFAIVRTGYGNTLKFPDQTDRQFTANIEGALAAGLDVGAYHFSYAKTPRDAQQEARCVLELIKDYQLTYPVCFDYEYDSDRVTGRPGREQLTAIAAAFLAEIEQAGYFATLYSNQDFCRNRYNMPALSRYDLWLADYNKGEPCLSCGMRQTGSTGKLSGISGNVDTDIAYKDYPAIIRAGGLNGWEKDESDEPENPNPAASATVTAKSGLNLRRGPSTGNSVVTAIPYGETVEVLEQVSLEWNKVFYKGLVGYCYRPYLSGYAPKKLEAGAKVQYSGPLYADSYGGGKGKTVSGTYVVQRVISGRKCGVQLAAGWVSAALCTVV